jgi:hypothetical protein
VVAPGTHIKSITDTLNKIRVALPLLPWV